MMNVARHEFPAAGVRRRVDDRLVAGVAGGIADRLGISAWYVRAAFVALSVVWGLGVLFYVAAWAATIDETGRSEPLVVAPTTPRLAGLAVALVGVFLVLRSVLPWPGDGLVWSVLALCLGGAVVAERRVELERLADPRYNKARLFIGAGLLVGGLVVMADVDPALVAPALFAALLTAAGIAIAAGPWLYRAVDDLGRERRERIRQEERAEMASHLHDSVLQTLAMIQRTDDPKRIATLARAQERALRRWLFDSEADVTSGTVAGGLQAQADRIESDFDVAVEVVTVGDAPLDDRSRALVAAAGEAMTNAARHAGVERISVFLEVLADRVDVFVSDQGQGFDREAIPADRRGVSESIVKRVERQGGTVEIESKVGEGTEVHLSVPGGRS